MSVKRSSYYIDSHGRNPEAIASGLLWLAETGTKPALLAVNGLAVLDSLSSVTGDAFVKVLKKNKVARLSAGLTVSLVTEKETKYSWNGPVLCIYPNQKLLDKIDGISGVTDVLVVPWTEGEVSTWIKTWAAVPLGSAQDTVVPGYDMDPTLICALRDLTDHVNVSTGISHPMDRSAAIWLFRILREDGIRFDPDAVKAWLLAEGRWTPSGANAVQNVASDILARKRLPARQRTWASDILKQWKERAIENQNT